MAMKSKSSRRRVERELLAMRDEVQQQQSRLASLPAGDKQQRRRVGSKGVLRWDRVSVIVVTECGGAGSRKRPRG